MSSSDWLQLTTLINRLNKYLNPFMVVQEAYSLIEEAITAVTEEPRGDPDELDRLATAFDTCATDCTSYVGLVRAHANDKLPHAWTGYAGSAASDAVNAIADDIDATPTAFAEASSALRTLATRLRAAKKSHSDGRSKLSDAGSTAINAIRMTNAFLLGEAVGQAISAIGTCIHGYEQAQYADQQAASRFRDAMGDARVSYVQTGARVSEVDAAIMADQVTGSGSWDRGVMSDLQLARASAALNNLPPAQAAAVQKLLKGASNDTERAYLLKALGAGYNTTQITAFDQAIHGHSPAWLNEHLNLTMADLGAGGTATADGAPVVQKDETTCGSTSILMTRILADPLYALYLTTGNHPNDPNYTSTTAFQQRLAAEEQKIHDLSTKNLLPPPGPLSNIPYPEGLGTPPWGATQLLNTYGSATGVDYHTHLVDDADSTNINAALASVEQSVDSGTPAIIYTGDGIPRHIMVVVGHTGDTLQVYEPGGGGVITISEDDFRNGHMNGAGGWPHVDFVLTPDG